MVSTILNTYARPLMIFRMGFVLLWLVTCWGCPQQPATQDEPAITQSEPILTKEAPVRAESELTPEKSAPIAPEIPLVTPQNARVRELQEERLRVCQELVKNIDVQIQHGVISLEAGWKARENLWEAQLDLAETQADRVRIHQETVQALEAWHKVVKKQVEFAMTNRSDELWIRSNLLKAQIALEKEKALPN